MRNICIILFILLSSFPALAGGGGEIGGDLQIALIEDQYDELVVEITDGRSVDITIPSKGLLIESNKLIELSSTKIKMKSSFSDSEEFSIIKTKENENSFLFLEDGKAVIEVSIAE